MYYTGHGIDLERDTYYLITKKARTSDLGGTALAARDLLALLTLRDGNGGPLPSQPTVLLILDCCYSGSAGMTMLGEALRGIGNPNTWVIASAGALEYAQQGLFAKAFCDALRRPTTGPSQRFVHPLTIVDAVNEHLNQAQQQALLFQPATGATHTPPFFPNPGYQPGVAGMTVADQQHWLSRVRAGPDKSTTGFYLTGKTGRLRAVENLAEWMADPGPGRLAVVTGSPGSGKSALLALPALLMEQSQRGNLLRVVTPGSLIELAAHLFPLETPVAAVHARGLNTDQTAGAIAQALGRNANTAAALLEVLDAAPLQGEHIVVVDAVDEAISPATLLHGLLVPLSHQPNVRVVAGARRHVLAGVSDSAITIDLDTGTYRDPEALTDYIYRLLIAAEEPLVTTCYQPGISATGASRAETVTVAAAIAWRATSREGGAESFLIGRLLALAVRARPEPADVTSTNWQSELPNSVAEAFDEDLARLGDKRPLAQALLEALAWAKGPGLPWEMIWLPVARALAERGGKPYRTSITNDDVRWLLDKAGAYVVEDVGPGQRSVFRPFHDLLALHLRGEPSYDRIDSDSSAERNWKRRRHRAEQSITGALLATVPAGQQTGRDWVSAHPYLRTYLAQHAAAAGSKTLAAFVQDMDFLAVADPVTLSPLLSTAISELRNTTRIYRRARPLLGDDPRANAGYLQEARCALTDIARASEGSGILALYRTRFGSVRGDESILTLTAYTDLVSSVAFGTTPDGRLLLARGGDDGTVRVWDPVTGTPIGQPLTGHTDWVNSVAFGTTPDGRLLLASGGNDRTVRVWEPVTGTPVGRPLTGHVGWVKSVAFGTTPDGRLLLASGGERGTVQLWNPVTGTRVGQAVGRNWAYSVAFGTTPDGRLLLASGGNDSIVRLWDAVTSTQVGQLTAEVTSVAFGTTPDGRLLLAYCGNDSIVRLWDPVTGSYVGQLTGHTSRVLSVAFGTTPDGRLLLASGGDDRTVRMWDPVTGTPIGQPLTGHAGAPIRSVAFGTTSDRRLLLASGAYDGTVRLWDAVTAPSAGKPVTGHTGWVTSVAFGTTTDGRLLLASGGDDQTVRMWDPVTGTPIGQPLTGHTGWVRSVAFGTTPDGRLLLASGGDDQTVRMWDPVTGTPIGQPLTGHTDLVKSVAFGTTTDGRLLLASASHDKTVRVWDPVTGTPIGQPLTGHTDSVRSVAFGTTTDGRLLLASGAYDRTVRVWDPVTGTPIGQPLTGHTGWVNTVGFGTTSDGRLLLASGAYDRTVRVWDPVTGTPIGQPLTGHTGWVNTVGFGTTSDGRLLLASGGRDRTVRLWEPTSPVSVATLRRRSIVWSVAIFKPLLAIGDDEGVCVIEPQV